MFEATTGLLGCVEVAPQVVRLEMRGERRAGGNRIGSAHELCQVVAAAELSDQSAARLQNRVQRAEQALVVGDPVEGGRRKHHINGFLDVLVDLEQVGLDIGHAVGEGLERGARLGEHGRRLVGGDHATAGQALEQVCRDAT